VGLFYNAPEPTWGTYLRKTSSEILKFAMIHILVAVLQSGKI